MTIPSVILAYHRVAEVDPDPFNLAVTPAHFAEQLEAARRLLNPVTLGDLVKGVHTGDVPAGAVAVTFDDGYADNLHQARPLLDRHDVPATVFLATRLIDGRREFWWDQLVRIFLECEDLPDHLDLRLDGITLSRSLGGAARYGEADRVADRGADLFAGVSLSPRQTLFLELWRLLRPLESQPRDEALDHMLEWAGLDVEVRESHRVLSGSEALELGDGGLVQLCSHTVTHPLLSAVSAESQRTELEQSKEWLQNFRGERDEMFAYPFGGPRAFTAETARLVAESGYACGCTTIAGLVAASSDPFRLARLSPGDWDGDRFTRWLTGCLGDR